MNSFWLDSHSIFNPMEPLKEDIDTDICIIGAGIFGLTCGYYLSKLGYRVVLLEKDEIGQKTSGHTTAKITSQHDLFYDYLLNSFDEKLAKDYLLANQEAIYHIKDIIDEESISCDFEFQSNFVYTTKKSEVSQIEKEVKAVQSLDFPAQFVAETSLPFKILAGIQFPKQAQFHPMKYMDGLVSCILKRNGKIYTNTPAFDLQKDENAYFVSTPNHKVHAKFVVLACHYPFLNFPGLYFTKMYQSTSYIIGISTSKTLPSGMYINPSSPVYSFRTVKHKGKRILLIGGADHKTGMAVNEQQTYSVLEKKAKELYPDCKILYRWNTRDCISLDKIPYIGLFSNTMDNVYIGTGFKKWGMTLSNVAAQIIVDKIQRKENSYSYVFDSTRMQPIKNHKEVKNMLVESTNSLLFNKLKHSELSFDSIANNSGGIIEINGQKVGIYKDSSGNLYAVKPICTHLGCLLSWNDVDKTWDCPCHGSRFDFMGKNIYDPALLNLEIYHLKD